MKDYYEILEIEKSASEDEIRKSYRKLALIHHPDKNQNSPESVEKFKEISEAYSTLSNPDKKKEYDMFGSVDDNEQGFGPDPFSVFNNIFQEHLHSFMNMQYERDINIGNIFSNIPGFHHVGGEMPFGNIRVKLHTFQTDVDQENRHNINNSHNNFHHQHNDNPFIQQFMHHSPMDDLFEPRRKPNKTIVHDKPEDTIYSIHVSIEDIYLEKKKKIKIERMRKKKDGTYGPKSKTVEIPIYGREVFLEEEGDEKKNHLKKANVVIQIFNKKNDKFSRINEYDLVVSKKINLIDLYRNIYYDLELPNKKVIQVQGDGQSILNGKGHIQKIPKYGLPYVDENNEKKQGNLYVIYEIEYPKTLDELKVISEGIHKNFTVQNDIIVSYPCEMSEIFPSDSEEA